MAIESIRHKALRRLYEDDNAKGLNAEHIRKLKQILAVLDAASTIEGVNMPGFGLHPLTADREGEWAVIVRANWRVTFRFEDGKALGVNYEDYH